ncbi:MAG TPA: TylF/MycF/NovP-related O-methyltransferase [Capsulimonadaceae bacterium]
MEAERFSFVHLDADIYESTVNGIEWFYPRTNSGGVIVVHDYASPITPGVTKAIDDFFVNKPERIIRLPAYQAVIVKLAG